MNTFLVVNHDCLKIHFFAYLQAGDVKEVRIVTNRSGKPKGYAYIEYLDEVLYNVY